jgi:hypothetical protein
MARTTHRRCVRLGALALALAVVLGAVSGVAAAAGTTSVGVSAEATDVAAGETTAVDIVVEDADGGVGAVEATLTLSDPAVASVADVTFHGDPGLTDVSERDDGVELSAALADTADTGRVTVATVVLSADGAGETAVDVDVESLGDEDGTAYTVDSVDRPTITVAADGSGSDGSGSSGAGGSQADATGSGDSLGDATDSGDAGGSGATPAASGDEASNDGSAASDGQNGDSAGTADTANEGAAGEGDEATDAHTTARTDDRTADERGREGVTDADGSTDRIALSGPGGASLAGPVGAVGALVLATIALYRYRRS